MSVFLKKIMQKVAIIMLLLCFFVMGNSIENLAVENTATTGSTAADLAEGNLSEIIGATVTGYDDYEYSVSDVGWKIFYVDEENIYLIADNYIEYEYIPSNSNGNKPSQGSYTRSADPFYDALSNDYIGATSIVNDKLKALNSLLYASYPELDYRNMKVVAYMMDQSAWGKYVGPVAEYAIGSPTIELLFKSYNAKYGTNYQARVNDTGYTGYEISIDGENWSNHIIGMLNTDDSTYVISSTTNASAMWIASPSIYRNNYLMGANASGYVGGFYGNSYGFRPIVCLKSDVKLKEKENEDGTKIYKIIDVDTKLDSEITITGTSEITSSSELVSYEINYEISIEDYTGNGTATIIYYLPYAIDTNASKLDGGTYSDEGGEYTITWEIDLGNIDTVNNNDYNNTFTRNISLIFVGLDTSADSMTNKVTGEVNIDDGWYINEDYDTFDTNINIEEAVDEPVADDTTEGDDVTTENLVDDDKVVEEVTETEDETTSNPTTGDTIVVFAVLFVIAVAGIVFTIKMRKKQYKSI